MQETAQKPGLFITLEGIDGAGKSTHAAWIMQVLNNMNIPALLTREPGGTELGEQLRALLLHESMQLDTEALLMFAARNEHIQSVIKPALATGKWVVCDRFTDASYAYQGGGRGMPAARLKILEDWVHAGFEPDCSFFFDVPLSVARQRLQNNRQPDRFEKEQNAFFERVQAVYQDRARHFPGRILSLDAGAAISHIQAEIKFHLHGLATRWR